MHWAETEKKVQIRNRCILSSLVSYLSMFLIFFAFHAGVEAESQKSLAPAPSPSPQQSTNNGARQNQHSSRGNKSRSRPSTSSLNATLAPPLPLDDGQHGLSAAKKIGKSAAILKTAIVRFERSHHSLCPILRHKEKHSNGV